MHFLKNIRIKIGQYLLNNKLKKNKRQIKICNLRQAKHIGIIYNNLSKDDVVVVKNLEKEYTHNNINVEVLGFSNHHKENGDEIGDLKHNYVNLNNFTWFYQPQSEEITAFINKKFDILINLYTENEFPVDYIIESSSAFFKVGSAHMNEDIHDLMIDSSSKTDDTKYLSEQINRYLNMINA